MKKKILTGVMSIVGILLVVLMAGGTYFFMKFPAVGPAPRIKVEITPERIQRGEYLANSVSSCMDCHSTRDWKRFSGPMVPGTEGGGGERFDRGMGLPGVIYSRNITPAALATWTDGEIYRAFTSGVSKDGHALFPIMPYPEFSQMSVEDARSVIAYLRQLKPIEKKVPARELDFPMNLIVRVIPKEAHLPKVTPKPSDGLVYGKYLTTIAACTECHTQKNHGTPVQGMEFAGGMEFRLPDGATVRSANITPDKGTGIGGWTQAQFISRFKNVETPVVAPGGMNTVMPWSRYKGMTEEDLGAIYSYLQSLKPVRNPVVTYTSAHVK